MYNLHLPCTSKKLFEHWLGPYRITKKIGPNTIELLLPKSMYIHPVINISWIKPYKECLPGQPANQPSPSHIMEDWDKEYEVDYIFDSRWKGHRLKYLIHWKGYNNSEHMWESWATSLMPKRQSLILPMVVPILYIISTWPIWTLSISSASITPLPFMMVTIPLLIIWKLIFKTGVVLLLWFFFLFFLLLTDLPFPPLCMDIMSHSCPCDSFWLVLSLTCFISDTIPLLGSSLLELCLMSPLTHL